MPVGTGAPSKAGWDLEGGPAESLLKKEKSCARVRCPGALKAVAGLGVAARRVGEGAAHPEEEWR